MRVSLIAAIAINGTIGRGGGLPWRLRDDMRFFVEKTRGHAVVTGRKNLEAMGRALPKRRNIVVSRREGYAFPGAEAVTSVEAALQLAAAGGEEDAFVIGGAQIYALALPYAHTFYRTRVLAAVPGDVAFPDFDEAAWRVTVLAEHSADDDNDHPFVVEELTSRTAPAPFGGP